MAYYLRHDQPLADAIRRVAREQIAAAAGLLGGPHDSGHSLDEAVHEARKSCKKVKALLRLLGEKPDSAFDEERHFFRNTGRTLSALRDRQAMPGTFDRLAKEYPGKIDAKTAAAIRRGLARRKQAAEHEKSGDKKVRAAAAALRAAEKRVAGWPVAEYSPSDLKHGYRKSFQRSRKAMARARKDPKPGNDHEWRKRVKDHFYDLRLLLAFASSHTKRSMKRVRRLEDYLGDLHNMTVLRAHIAAEPGVFAAPEGIRAFLNVIDRHEKKLRKKAFALGAKVYGGKSGL